MSWFDAIIIAIVEGLTEFLPISSTGHMVITEAILGHTPDAFSKAYVVNIQFGAILSVLVLYLQRFFKNFDFYFKLFIAFLPAAVIGFFMIDFIDSILESVMVIAISLVVGGVVLIFVDKWFSKTDPDQSIGIKRALIIGFFQVIAMIPGVSRSAATIVGGMSQGLTRKTAAEFSFFLAVPTMFGASAYKLLQNHEIIGVNNNLQLLIVGNIIAFIVALLAIKAFISFLTKFGFRSFGVYRIIVGATIIILLSMGIQLNIV
ncbi:MAG: undecaprenyl-diphosphate phosphatase [Bacteroidales bacterium]|nr:undecaprenyl-diphosphate phosphatase [Bacteroidales bacterium]